MLNKLDFFITYAIFIPFSCVIHLEGLLFRCVNIQKCRRENMSEGGKRTRKRVFLSFCII